MTTFEMSDKDLHETAQILNAFAAVLSRDDVARAVARQLADELGDVGGARYADAGDSPMGPAFVAQRARELAGQFDTQRSGL